MQTRTHAQKFYLKVGTEKTKIAAKGSIPLKKRKLRPPKKARPKKEKERKKEINQGPETAARTPWNGRDILLPITAANAARPANKEFMELVKMNCILFHSLPKQEQFSFCHNLCHFLLAVRARRFLSSGPLQTYQSIPDPVKVVENTFRSDEVKVASLRFRPFWLLGEHDPDEREGSPFVHRDLLGNWRKMAKIEQVRLILQNEGPKNLLLLPASIQVEVFHPGFNLSTMSSGGSRIVEVEEPSGRAPATK